MPNGASSSLANTIAGSLAVIDARLDELVKDPQLIALYGEGDKAALATQAERLAGDIPPALKVRLFLPGDYDLEPQARPPLGFASLDLLRQAETGGADPVTELHAPGGEDAHVVIVRRVVDDSGRLVGLVHVSLPATPYIRLEDRPPPGGYIELIQEIGQKPMVLAQAGNPKLRQGNPARTRVQGTRWAILYWGAAAQGEAGKAADFSLATAALILLLLVMVAAASGYVFYRRRLAAREAGAALEVVYGGAIKAIMEGRHPGLERLIPGLPRLGQSQPVTPLSQGLNGEDITRIAKPVPAPPAETTSQAPVVNGTPAVEGTAPSPGDAQWTDASTSQEEDLHPVIFRAYDIRGVVGKTLTAAGVAAIGQAIATEAVARGQATLVVGRDGRNSSPELAETLIQGLCAAGCDIIDIGQVPTPVLYFATHHLDTRSGVMVTGSHNGPEYNGLKIVLAGETLAGDAIQALQHRITSGDLGTGRGSVRSLDVTADYQRRATEDIPVALGGAFKLVVDAGNGVAGAFAPQMYRALGHDVVELYCEVDGNFPNHHPDPSQPQNLRDLIEKVLEEQADLGLAFDGDGDRLGVVDSQGTIIWPDRLMMLFARDVLSRHEGAPVIFDVKCSRHLGKVIERCGGTPVMWKTGHSLLKARMAELQAPLAGEMSGHIFFAERWYGFDDALYAGARLLEILAQDRTAPAEVFAALPGGVATPELRIPLAEADHAGFMRELRAKTAFAGAEITDIDGVRADFADGWGLIRPSNTSPCLVARFEADDQAALEKIQSEFRGLIQSIAPDLTLPF